MSSEANVVTWSMKEVFIGIGIELGYLIGLPSVTVLGGWRITFGMALLFAFIMMSGMVSRQMGLAEPQHQSFAASKVAQASHPCLDSGHAWALLNF